MSMAAENSGGIVLARILQSPCRYFRRHAQPTRVQPVDEPNDGLVLEIQLLQFEVERCAQPAEANIVYLEAVKLMAVDGNVPKSAKLPSVALIHPHADQVRHDVGEAVVVIA